MTPAEIRRLAALARLDPSDAEAERLAAALGAILAHVASLPPLKADAPADPAESPSDGLPLRDDTVAFDPLRLPPGTVAPAWVDGFFVVPRLAALDPDRAGGDAP